MHTVRRFGLAALLVAATAVTASAQQLDTTAYAHLRYRFIGPDGNRASAVVGEPGNPSIAYVGAASGGVFKTTDGGVTWHPVFDKQDAQAIGSLAIAPSAHNIVWAGTGETFIIRSLTAIGDGIYKSTDRGKTWTHMGLEKTGRIGRIVINPRDPDIVYACALGNAFGPQQERGVYRTTNGGATWSRVLFVDPNTGCSDLAIDPNNPQVLFAGMWQLQVQTWNLKSGGPSGGVYVSRDGGTTWKKLTGHGLPAAGHPVGKIAVAVAPSNSDRVYALIEQHDPTLYRSDDGGENWDAVSHNHTMAERAPYYVRFAVAPDDENRLYFVSVRFSMSLDGGKTLVPNPPRGGGDNHDVWIDPTNPNRFMVGNDGGATITLNRGKTFQRVVLPIAQLYHVFTDTKVPYHVYTNRQDDDSYDLPSNTRATAGFGGGGIEPGWWHTVGGCESGFAVPDTVNNALVWSGCYDGGLQLYDERTGQARDVRIWPEGGYGWPPKDVKYRWNWTFPIAISPHDHNKVYVGSQVVHMTTNGGSSWKVISPDLTKNDTTHEQSSGGVGVDNLMTFDGATLFAIAESPVRAGVIWVGSNDGLVHLTKDGGAHWTDVTANIPKLPPWGKITNIVPSHFDSATAYLAVDLHEMADFDPYIYKTTDYGKTWKRIDAGIPRSVFSFVHMVAEDPTKPGVLYAGTENGIYFTLDDGAHWQTLQLNLPHAPVTWITVQSHFHDLVLSTYGRGAYILDDVAPLRALDAQTLAAPLTFFATRPAYRFRSVNSRSSNPNGAVRGQNPPYGADLNYFVGGPADTAHADSAKAKAKIVILDGHGDTVRTMSGPAEHGMNRTWWNLRYDAPHQPRLRMPPPGRPWVKVGPNGTRRVVNWDLDLFTGGPLAPPGDYTVKITVGDQTRSQTLTVLKDPHSVGTPSDVAEQAALALTIRAEQQRTADLINRVEWMRKQLAELRTQLGDDPSVKGDTVAKSIAAGAKALDAKLLHLEGALFDVHLTGAREDDFRAPQKLWGHLASLASDVGQTGVDFAPTAQEREVNTLLAGRLDKAAQAFDQLMAGDVATFRARLHSAKLPDVFAGGQ